MSFDFFEEVLVQPRPDAPPDVRALRGRLGCVLGKSSEEGQAPTGYAVALDGVDDGWLFDARDLVSTGKARSRKHYYEGSSIQVSPDGELRSSYTPERFAQVLDPPEHEVVSFVVLGHWRQADGREQWCLEYLDDVCGEVRDDDYFASEAEAEDAANREFELDVSSWRGGAP
jgi:hypothetical protein